MSRSLSFYDDRAQAERYHRRQGFAPTRKARMLAVTLDLLTALAPVGGTLLELGAGTGHFTEKVVAAGHFREIVVTDGAEAMLAIARETLVPGSTRVRFRRLDFTTAWAEAFAGSDVDAVTSAMALHHAEDKPRLFRQVFAVLKPGGVFVFADHMAGTSAAVQHLIARERALLALGRPARERLEQVQALIRQDEEQQQVEGNRCESVARYERHLAEAGFVDVDCLWRDYWLAVFVARKRVEG